MIKGNVNNCLMRTSAKYFITVKTLSALKIRVAIRLPPGILLVLRYFAFFKKPSILNFKDSRREKKMSAY
jgi:hypothetical protein